MAPPEEPRSTRSLRSVLARSGVGVWSLSDGRLEWDGLSTSLLGCGPPGDLDGYLDLVHPDDRAHVAAGLARFRESGGLPEFEHRLARAPARWIGCFAAPLLGDAGEPRGLTGVFVDVTARKAAAEELKARAEALARSEERLSAAVASTGIAIWEWWPASGEARWSSEMLALHQASETPSAEEYLARHVHPDDRARAAGIVERVAAGQGGNWQPYRIVRPDGEVRWVLLMATAHRDAAGAVRVVGGAVDVTEQRAQQERLERIERMEALGAMTSGVAHNLNNMLAAVIPALDLLEGTVPADRAPLLTVASQAATRAADVVRDLMVFAGQGRTRARQRVRLGDLAKRVVAGARGRLTADVDIEVNVRAPDLAVECDPIGLGQALRGLLVNAGDAVREGGGSAPRIEVEVDEVTRVGPEDPGPTRYGRALVRDNGPGMSPEVRARCFEPFFTTKPSVRSGLGLATIQAVASDHGGWVECGEAPGGGAAFECLLPLVAGETEPDAAAPAREGRSLVLVVDDEPAVRDLVAQMLVSPAVEVATAAGAEAALRVVAARGAEVDLVLLDRSMPDGPGDRIVPDLRRQAPRARILFFTGQDVTADELAAVDGLITKPVGVQTLRAAVAAHLRR